MHITDCVKANNLPRKIVGGVFGIPAEREIGVIPTEKTPAFLAAGVEHARFVNARSALAVLLERLSPRHIWLPSYLCDSVLVAVEQMRIPCRFFPVNSRLRCANYTWLEDVRPHDVVVTISYFGFSADEIVVCKAKERGAWVVEDASQALLMDEAATAADFVLFSPRKFVGVPDGGILVSYAAHGIREVILSSPPDEWWLQAYSACSLRRDYEQFGVETDWFRRFQHSEAEAPCGRFSMTGFSEMLLMRAFDYSDIAARRRTNYQSLLGPLSHLALFPELPPKVVPLGFPIRVSNRDAVREALFQESIFPPVHWSLKGMVPDEFVESHELSREILTLVCDQRYGPAEMDRTAAIVLRNAALCEPAASAL